MEDTSASVRRPDLTTATETDLLVSRIKMERASLLGTPVGKLNLGPTDIWAMRCSNDKFSSTELSSSSVPPSEARKLKANRLQGELCRDLGCTTLLHYID